MGCCESKKYIINGVNSCKTEQVKRPIRQPLTFSEYSYSDLAREIDLQVVCITKPEYSYIIKLDNTQLETWTLYNLEVKIIEDLQDHMIESFRFSQMKDIQKSFYSQKIIQFMDLFPLYIELSVDETMDYIQVEISHTSHYVINIPYDPNTTIKYIKKKIADQVQLPFNKFELMHQGEVLLFDDMSLEECKIYPKGIIIVAEITNLSLPHQISFIVNNKHVASNQDLPQVLKRIGTLEQDQDATINNITKIMTKAIEEDQTMEFLDNFDVISTKSQDYHNMHRIASTKQQTPKNQSNQSPLSKRKMSENKQKSIAEIKTKKYLNTNIVPGLVVVSECKNCTCSQYQVQQVINLSYGEFFMNQKEQSQIVSCASCQQGLQINEFLFYQCSYIISGIYKLKQQNVLEEKTQLYKLNDCQYINIDNDQVDHYEFQEDEKDWKSVRIRVCSLKKDKMTCSFCLRKINYQNENYIKLTCNHIYHDACIQKLKSIDSTCLMCVF